MPGAGVDVTLAENEPIVVGRSYKYYLPRVAELLMRARFRRRAQWIDYEHGYVLTLAEATEVPVSGAGTRGAARRCVSMSRRR